MRILHRTQSAVFESSVSGVALQEMTDWMHANETDYCFLSMNYENYLEGSGVLIETYTVFYE